VGVKKVDAEVGGKIYLSFGTEKYSEESRLVAEGTQQNDSEITKKTVVLGTDL